MIFFLSFFPLFTRSEYFSKSGRGDGYGDLSDGDWQGQQKVYVQDKRRILLDSSDSWRDPIYCHRSVSISHSLKDRFPTYVGMSVYILVPYFADYMSHIETFLS